MTKKKVTIITIILLLVAVSLFIILTANKPVTAKSVDGADSQLGCGAKDCKECHSISKQDVTGMLEKLNAGHVKVMNIQMSPVKGLWEVIIDDKGQRGVLYIDFSKNYAITGQIIAVDQRIDITRQKLDELEKDRRVDVSKIPLHDAIIMGNPNAAKKVIMFTDPG